MSDRALLAEVRAVLERIPEATPAALTAWGPQGILQLALYCRRLLAEMEALEDQPPPADAALLAAANRELVGQIQEANGQVQRLSTSLAILREEAERERDELRAFADLQRAKRESVQRERDEARTEIARLRSHAEAMVAEIASNNDCDDCGTFGFNSCVCPVAAYRHEHAAHLDGEKEPTP